MRGASRPIRDRYASRSNPSGMRSMDPQASGFGFRAAGFRLQASGFRLRATGYGLQTSGLGSDIAGAAAMARDPRKLRVFRMADELLLDVYRVSAMFPADERYGIRSQLRRAAVSAATNVVEGCARRTQGEYVQFLSVAIGSAAEAEYLLDVAHRLGFLTREAQTDLGSRYAELLRGLQKLVSSLSPQPEARSPKPEARSLKPVFYLPNTIDSRRSNRAVKATKTIAKQRRQPATTYDASAGGFPPRTSAASAY